MKGQRTFRASAVARIRQLLAEKVSASRSMQKRIRHEIRGLGFCISDFPRVRGGFTPQDFQSLIDVRQIRIAP